MGKIVDQANIIDGVSFCLGVIQGKEKAADHLLRLAGDFFVRGEDNQANLLRSLARELRAETRKEKAEWDKQQQPRQSKAYEILTKRDDESDEKEQ